MTGTAGVNAIDTAGNMMDTTTNATDTGNQTGTGNQTSSNQTGTNSTG
ncbi:MAG TPA: hypothetical protein VD736_01700 [Nitrososphaera sp.]|nr:hypothetical protein [Nitrososphaera sp.]